MPAFKVDEQKLRSALPVETSSTAEDLKWSGALFGVIAAFIALLLYVGWLLLRALI